MELKGIKGIDTFVQTQEPTTQTSGDVWVRPGHQGKRVWMKDRWNRPMWRDAVLDVFWAPGADYGYSCRGYNNTNSVTFSQVNRISFPFDSGVTNLVGYIEYAASAASGCNSSSYGYTLGGGSTVSHIQRFTFPFDSGTASRVGNLSGDRRDQSGFNSSNYGYCGAGVIFASDIVFSTVDRITFPFDSGTASHVGNLSDKLQLSGFNSSTYGYSCGGRISTDRVSTHYSTVDRITFPFDSGTATHVGNLSGSVSACDGFNSSTYGYSCGGLSTDGSTTFDLSTIDRVAFPFDSGTATHVGNLSGSITRTASFNSTNYGYICGGIIDYVGEVSTIDRIAFPFDSGTATHVGNISASMYQQAGVDGTDFVTLFV